MPWQGIVAIVTGVAAIILIIVIIVVKNNKNFSANGEYKENKFGLSITDSGNKSTELEEQVKKYYITRINTLKIHPLFTTIINHVLYKSDTVDYRIKELFKLINNDELPISSERLSKLVDMTTHLFKCYVTSFKSSMDDFLNRALEDISRHDMNFTKSVKYMNSFMKDVESGSILVSIIDTVKMVGFNNDEIIRENEIYKDDVPSFFYTTFAKHVKSKTSDFYRDITISNTIMFSSSSNTEYDSFLSFVHGCSQLLDSITEYLYTLCCETKYEFILDICKSESIIYNSQNNIDKIFDNAVNSDSDAFELIENIDDLVEEIDTSENENP